MFLDNFYITRSNIGILIFSLIFALVVGSGLYGYGIDYYAAYHKLDLVWGGIYDRIGYRVATLSVNGIHVGVHLTTFILASSVGILIREHLISKNIYSGVLFLYLYIVVIHTWPIIMSTSNAMRQGLSMSLIFLALVCSNNKSYVWLIIFSLMSIFMHKSGLLLSVIVLFATFIHTLLKNFSYKSKLTIHFLFGTVLLIALHASIAYAFDTEHPSKIIEGDFRAAFLLISFAYVSLSFFCKSILNTPFSLTLYYFSFLSPAVVMNGLNWEYERLGMMMLIPYILAIGAILNRTSHKFYLVIVFVALLFMTIYMGMYEVGLT